MQVAKWGNSLAVRLPKELVAALHLKEGDELKIRVEDTRSFRVARDDSRQEALKKLRALKWNIPADFKFDREEAHERGYRLDEPHKRPSRRTA
jgi:antitoxin MazE